MSGGRGEEQGEVRRRKKRRRGIGQGEGQGKEEEERGENEERDRARRGEDEERRRGTGRRKGEESMSGSGSDNVATSPPSSQPYWCLQKHLTTILGSFGGEFAALRALQSLLSCCNKSIILVHILKPVKIT